MNLRALRLQDTPHDVDRRVMAVEQRGRSDNANLVASLKPGLGGCGGGSRGVGGRHSGASGTGAGGAGRGGARGRGSGVLGRRRRAALARLEIRHTLDRKGQPAPIQEDG